MSEAASRFGTCCDDLRQAMHPGKNSMFSVDDGILFLNIAIVPMKDATGWFTKPVKFCPFCGASLQSAEDIQAWSNRA